MAPAPMKPMPVATPCMTWGSEPAKPSSIGTMMKSADPRATSMCVRRPAGLCGALPLQSCHGAQTCGRREQADDHTHELLPVLQTTQELAQQDVHV